ncbi:MAG: O-antigen ligase family protein [Akkermansiaceae bacterium]
MPLVSSIFLVTALILAVLIGPQTRPWTWGPAMLALSFSALAALPTFWRKGKLSADFGLLALGALTVAWFVWRAWNSPVQELGQADYLLVGAVVASFISIRAIAGNPLAERVLIWGMALLLLANVVVIGMQLKDPTFSPLFRERAAGKMTGFFAHYNETANYLIGASMLVAAAALTGRHATATRVLWILIALAGLAGVWFTRSRGGILGAAVACGVFAAVLLIIGKRKNAKWFAPALVAIPLVGLGIGAFLWMGWQEAQEIRHAGSGIRGLVDNSARLYLLGIALSCIGLHPLVGGGSQSFGWECFGFLDGKSHGGLITHKPELIHNELLQSATDYGLVGAGLLVGLLGTFILISILSVVFEERSAGGGSRTGDAWRLGGLAALAGMLVQSCFSFVFHLLPGIVLLGICLGQMSRPSRDPGRAANQLGAKFLLSAAALACAVLLIPAGWKGTQVTWVLWPSYFSKKPPSTVESKIDALGEAIRIWPQSELYQDRAGIHHVLVAKGEGEGLEKTAELAIRDYAQAALFHPYDPGPAANQANLLSYLERDSEAEEQYERAIALQGGMEPGFRAHFWFSKHLLRKGLREFRAYDPAPALAVIEAAAQQMEAAAEKMHWISQDMREPRVSVHEKLGAAREANGNYEGALESYNFTTTLPGGIRAHYRAGLVHGKIATARWAEKKPAEAMAHFMEAKRRIGMTRELPKGVTLEKRLEYVAYLDQMIGYFKKTKVEPSPLSSK